MKINRIYSALLLCLLISMSISSCTDDKIDPEEEQSGSDKSYTLAIRSNSGGEVATDYLVMEDSLMTGEISLVGRGIEQSGYHFYQQTGPYLTTVTYTDANVATVYKLTEENKLEEHIQFTMGRTHLFHPVDDHNFIAMNIPRGGSENAVFYQVDVESGAIVETTANVYTPTRGSGEQAYFSSMTIRDDKLFVPFFQIAASDFSSNQTDSAYIAIYSYPELAYEGVITDPRTGPVGAYAAQGYIFTTENKDVYTVSSAAIATGFSKETKPSGILRIKAGENTFDENYFFNVQEESGGYRICNAQYIGNNKVLTSIYSFDESGYQEGDKWSRRDVRLAILDVVTKKVNYIEDVPIHYGGPTGTFSNHFIEDEGKIYIKIANDDGIFIYEVNPETYTATQGAEVKDAAAVYGFFNLNQ